MDAAVAKLDEMGKGAWILAMILGFVLFWPIGLAILFYMIWSGRMGCMHHGWNSEMREEWRARKQEWRDRKREWKQQMRERWQSHQHTTRSSGNSAFDEYKTETIRRLEEEQEAFKDFLEQLRKSKDRAEFEQFMDARRRDRENGARDVTPEGRDGPETA